MMRIISKPGVGEYAPYTLMYIGLLPDDGRVLDYLEQNLWTTLASIRSRPEATLTARHAEGEWTIKEIVAHISDDERIYAYRALRFARSDKTELPGFEQDDYSVRSGANERGIEDLLAELTAVRRSTIAMFASFTDEALMRIGVADGKVMSVRAAAYHIAGHELHHMNSISENYP
jgi:uncharacterized damage-inducible protein DinB